MSCRSCGDSNTVNRNPARTGNVVANGVSHEYLLTPFDQIWDETFKQNFVKPGFLAESQIKSAGHGLWEAVNSGVFTQWQYAEIARMLSKVVRRN